MATNYSGYMGKVMLVDLTTEADTEYPWTDVPQDPRNPKTKIPLETMKKTYYADRGWDKNGIREMQLEAASVKEALAELQKSGIAKKDLDGCVILINGKNANKRSKLTDGDTVVLMSPVAGG